MRKKMISLLLYIMMVMSFLPTTVFADRVHIDTVNIIGVQLPDPSTTVGDNLKSLKPASTEYYILSARWYRNLNNSPMGPSEYFSSNESYTLKVSVRAQEGYSLDSNTIATLNNGSIEMTDYFTEDNNIYCQSVSFTAKVTIDSINIKNVQIPAAGVKAGDNLKSLAPADASYTIHEAAWTCMEGIYQMQPDDVFEVGKTYALGVSVTAKTGYTLSENTSFMFNGGDITAWDDIKNMNGGALYGFTVPIEVAPKNHDFSKYVSNGNGTHKIVCKDCGTVLAGHDKDICSGGTATSTSKAKCTLCGAEYGALAGPVNNGGEGQKPQNSVAVSSSIEQVEKDLQTLPENGDLKGSTYATLQAKVKKTTKSSEKLSWKMVPGAAKYTVYGAKCGTKYKKLADVQNLTWTQKKLKKGTYYKYIVVASDASGKILATSKSIHAATSGGKYGNQTSIKLSKKKVSLKQGKTVTVKATIKNSAGKVKNHRKLTYESTNTAFATVSKKGKIKTVGAGTCTIYAYAQNGICATVKVTVK